MKTQEEKQFWMQVFLAGYMPKVNWQFAVSEAARNADAALAALRGEHDVVGKRDQCTERDFACSDVRETAKERDELAREFAALEGKFARMAGVVNAFVDGLSTVAAPDEPEPSRRR